jgi:hypothetical protein
MADYGIECKSTHLSTIYKFDKHLSEIAKIHAIEEQRKHPKPLPCVVVVTLSSKIHKIKARKFTFKFVLNVILESIDNA